MTSPDEVNLRSEIEFELYFSEIWVLAAESIGIPAETFIDLTEEHPEVPVPFTAAEFRARVKEAFIIGFKKGAIYMNEDNS